MGVDAELLWFDLAEVDPDALAGLRAGQHALHVHSARSLTLTTEAMPDGRRHVVSYDRERGGWHQCSCGDRGCGVLGLYQVLTRTTPTTGGTAEARTTEGGGNATR